MVGVHGAYIVATSLVSAVADDGDAVVHLGRVVRAGVLLERVEEGGLLRVDDAARVKLPALGSINADGDRADLEAQAISQNFPCLEIKLWWEGAWCVLSQ